MKAEIEVDGVVSMYVSYDEDTDMVILQDATDEDIIFPMEASEIGDVSRELKMINQFLRQGKNREEVSS